MEPLREDELDGLLRTWKAPVAPEHLAPPVVRRPWYVGFWRMSVRVPVPVLALIVVAVIAYQVFGGRERAQAPPEALREVRLADFEPVQEVKPLIVRRNGNADR
ncbi:MAG TPA: hypothetical protein VER03_15865 [Bryobacteraceae bacterium]|nr:hypothetical protein [Bryobacteraceae bacterium]